MLKDEHSLDPSDWPVIRALSHQMLETTLDHVQGVEEGPVWTQTPDDVKNALNEPVPMKMQGVEKVCADLVQLVLPFSTGNTHPRFLGWCMVQVQRME